MDAENVREMYTDGYLGRNGGEKCSIDHNTYRIVLSDKQCERMLTLWMRTTLRGVRVPKRVHPDKLHHDQTC